MVTCNAEIRRECNLRDATSRLFANDKDKNWSFRPVARLFIQLNGKPVIIDGYTLFEFVGSRMNDYAVKYNDKFIRDFSITIISLDNLKMVHTSTL